MRQKRRVAAHTESKDEGQGAAQVLSLRFNRQTQAAKRNFKGLSHKGRKEKHRAHIQKQVPSSKEIRTKYRVIDTIDGLSLTEVELLTGRTHQIRAHFAFYGTPLLGDGKYGSNEQNRKYGSYKRQFLYSYKLTFDFTTDAGILSYLDKRTFEAGDVWFKEEFYKGGIVNATSRHASPKRSES